MKVSLFIPCYVDQFYPQIGISTAELLQRLGCEVDYPDHQICCGQPAFNAGFWRQARTVADAFVRGFHDCETIVVPSGSCAAMVKVFYQELANSAPGADALTTMGAKTWELSEFLVKNLQVTDVGARFPSRATFHDGCHGLRELGTKTSPRMLLSHVRDLELVETPKAEVCCGFGGVFSVKFPQISTAMAQVKCDAIAATGAEHVVSNDASCLMQLQGYLDRQGIPIKCLHLAEVLTRT